MVVVFFFLIIIIIHLIELVISSSSKFGPKMKNFISELIYPEIKCHIYILHLFAALN